MVKSLLSEADAKVVEAAVARVEEGTSAELVVAVVPRSADYWRGRVLLAVAWALAAGLGFLHFEPWLEPALSLLVELVVGLVVFAASAWTPLLRLLVPQQERQRAVRARAFQLFAERGLHGTKASTALLIFVSELEHRVVLLGDRTIHAELGQTGWDAEVANLVGRMREGKAREGLLEVLEHLAPKLAAVAPRRTDDVNELSDGVLRR